MGPLDATLRTIESEIKVVREQQHTLRFLLHQIDRVVWDEEEKLEEKNFTETDFSESNFDSPEKKTSSGHNPVTKAIVDKIIAKYGSMEEYYRSRKLKAGQSKVERINTREQEQLKECTFRPSITRFDAQIQKPNTPVDGIDNFLKRQEKAREILCMQKVPKPGSGKVYTGQVTKPVPFSFSKLNTHPSQWRE